MKIKRLRLEDREYNIWYVLARRRWEVGVNTCVFVYGVISVAITALEDTCVFEMYARQLLPQSNTCLSLGCTSDSYCLRAIPVSLSLRCTCEFLPWSSICLFVSGVYM